jgi:hypothetical protein
MALLLMLFFSCHLRQNDSWNGPGVPDQLAARITGIYNGHFKQEMITLVINYLSDSTVSGYDVEKDLRRNVNGEVQQKGGTLNFILKEPGNHPMDGTFYLSMDTASRAITGKWVPQDSSKVHTGWLDLKRWDKDTSKEYIARLWNGDLGELSINDDDGTCTLTYDKPGATGPPADREITIWGDYQQKVDTFYIDWQPNHHLPAQQMRLVKYPGIEGIEGSPNNQGTPPSLRGKGVKFIEVPQAG